MKGAVPAGESQLAGRAAGVEVEFAGEDGVRQRGPLSTCWNVAFERAAPVRGFASFRGQCNRPGLWWFATSGEHVGHESWLEVRHAPDYFVRRAWVADSCSGSYNFSTTASAGSAPAFAASAGDEGMAQGRREHCAREGRLAQVSWPRSR